MRLRQIIGDVTAELEVEILKGHICKDHVHLFVSSPPHFPAGHLAQRLKSSRKLMQESSHLKRAGWGRHVWARGIFVASSGDVTDVTDEMTMEYIENQERLKEDPDFKVDGGTQSGLQPTFEPTDFQPVEYSARLY